MRASQTVAFLMLIVLLALPGCYSTQELTQIVQENNATGDSIRQYVENITGGDPLSSVEHIDEIADYISGLEGVNNVAITPNEKVIAWEWASGGTAHLLLETRPALGVEEPEYTIDPEKMSLIYNDIQGEYLTDSPQIPEKTDESTWLPAIRTKSDHLTNNDKALVLAPYNWDFRIIIWDFLTDESRFIEEILSSSGFDTDIVINENESNDNFTLEIYENLNDYSVVSISTHGGVNANNDCFFSTGVRVTAENYSKYYNNYINLDELTQVMYIDNWFSDDEFGWAIQPRWFSSRWPSGFEDTLFYLSACHSRDNNSLANVIAGSGSTYFGWSDSVGSFKAAKTGKDLFSQLCIGASTAEAFQAAIKAGAKSAVFGYVGSPDLFLCDVPLKILVTYPKYDDIGQVFQQFGYDFDETSFNSLSTFDLSSYHILAINCSNIPDIITDQKLLDNIREFVQKGGTLYASDYAYSVVKDGFPGSIFFPSAPKIGHAQTIDAEVVDQELIAYLGTSAVSIKFDLGGWVIISGVGSETKVLVRGVVPEYSSTDIPLSAEFEYGTGRVIFTSFHNEVQASEVVRRILEYYIIHR